MSFKCFGLQVSNGKQIYYVTEDTRVYLIKFGVEFETRELTFKGPFFWCWMHQIGDIKKFDKKFKAPMEALEWLFKVD